MTTPNQKNPTTIFPDLAKEVPLVDKHGMMTDAWKFIFDQLFTAIQTNLKPEGFVLPRQTSTNMLKLKSPLSLANVLYNTTQNAFYGNVQETSQQEWWQFGMITSFAGNPNGHVAGNLYFFCYDTTDNILYICTVAGNAAGAVWTSIMDGMDAMLLL